MGRQPEGRNLNYISGITLANAKKFFGYTFGDFYYTIKKNPIDWTYDLYLIEEVKIEVENERIIKLRLKDAVDVHGRNLLKSFQNYWGNGFKVIIVELKNK